MSEGFKVSSKVVGTYDINFIDDLGNKLSELQKKPKSIFVVDQAIINLFNTEFEDIKSNGRIVIIDVNESNKTLNYSQDVIRKLLTLNVRKDDVLIAVGGGITQDIVAFISSVLFRGVEWNFIPTTLLAQCDSCIGSKSSINFDSYKNLIGTFNPPSHIYIYRGFLNTLTESEIRSGIGEMLHYFLSVGIDLAREIVDQIEDILIDKSKLEYFIKNSLRIKKNIIEIDEFDTSIRHIFNYGHTFGHALEAITNYKIPHGQAVTLGMDLANHISHQLGYIDLNLFNELHDILVKNLPEFEFTEDLITNYSLALSKDKKNQGGKIGCILVKAPGKLEKVFIDNDELLKQTILDYSMRYKFL